MNYDELMTLLYELFDYMEDEEKKIWSLEAAQEMVDDQHNYERQHGQPEGDYDVHFWHDTIAELIEAEESEE